MMHEEMLNLHRRITREVHKKHFDFFREHWDKFCAWANETAEECQRYWMQQGEKYYRRPWEVEHRRFDRILDIQGEAQRRGEKDLVARAMECQDHMRRSNSLRRARREEKLRLDFESQGWVQWDVRRNNHYGLFSWHSCIEMLWVPSDLVNPIGGIFGFEQARDPTPDQRLLCDCAVLSVLHDGTVQGADPRICPPGPPLKAQTPSLSDPRETDYFWQFNIGDRFVQQLRGHLSAMTQDGQIQAAWDRAMGFLPQGTRDGPRFTSLPIPQGTTDVNTQSMKWDVFISHASEDKEAFVRPLAIALQKKNVRVWFDEFALTVGDSLRRSIDDGLASSQYGIVVISPDFLAKEWPQKELDGLFAREVGGPKVILPVWHNVDAKTLRQYSPLLADRWATSTAKGIEAVVADVMKAMK